MNTLLIFFAFPIAVIIFSIVLQKLLHNPFAVAALVFAVFIVITFAFFDETFLIATLAYTVLAFITAVLVDRLQDNSHHHCHSCNSGTEEDTDAATCLCNALMQALENNNDSTNNVIDGLLDLLQNNNNNDNEEDDDTDTCSTANTTTSIPSDDNVIRNNCGYMYNRRCRRF